MKFLQRSLKARLLTFFILVAIVPLAITGYLVYDSGHQSIEAESEAGKRTTIIIQLPLL